MNENTETILLVDDEETVRDVLREALEREGFTVHLADSYSSAVKIAGRLQHLDLLIADVSLPGSNGCDLAQKLISLRSDLKALLISGYTGAEICRHYGVALNDLHFMAKPIQPKALVRRIRAILDAGEVWSPQRVPLPKPENREPRVN